MRPVDEAAELLSGTLENRFDPAVGQVRTHPVTPVLGQARQLLRKNTPCTRRNKHPIAHHHVTGRLTPDGRR